MPIRYGRPSLELEFDQQTLMQEGCCRFVQIVVRLCGVPHKQNVVLHVAFDRVRKSDHNGNKLDDYELHPIPSPSEQNFSNYYEYAVELLARAHDQETGTIRISMMSPSGSMLSQAEFRLDSRQAAPVQRECTGFLSTPRLFPYIRTPQERDALRGQPSAPFVQGLSTPPNEEGHSPVVHMAMLFPPHEEENR